MVPTALGAPSSGRIFFREPERSLGSPYEFHARFHYNKFFNLYYELRKLLKFFIISPRAAQTGHYRVARLLHDCTKLKEDVTTIDHGQFHGNHDNPNAGGTRSINAEERGRGTCTEKELIPDH